MTSAERRLKGLKQRQRSLLTSFGLIATYVDKYDAAVHEAEVPVRLEHLVTLWDEFNKVQAEIESVDEAGLDDQLKERTQFESTYYRVKGFLLSVSKAPPESQNTRAVTHIQQSSSHLRLPDVKLPVFNGVLDNWLNFHDLFVSLVHSSQDLSSIQKFYYLRSSLSGDALKLIQTISISALNYPVAWNLLVEHYQNPIRLKQSYVDALFDLSALKRESATELHTLVEKFESNVKILKQLGERTECWDVLLIRMLSTRLDPVTRRDWEDFASIQAAVTFADLSAFIQRRVNVLETIQPKTVDAPSANTMKKPASRPTVASHGASQFNSRKCLVCSENHPLYQCTTFYKMSVDDKEKEIRRLQLCRNCLRRGHQVRNCTSTSTCRKCQGRHHTQICSREAATAESNKKPEPAATDETPTTTPASATTKSSTEQTKAANTASFVEPVISVAASGTCRSVLLATAVVIVVDDNGAEHSARALLDSGSECCFVTESFSQHLKASRTKIHLPIAGIGQSSTQVRCKFSTTVRSRVSNFSTVVELLVLPKVTVNLPTASVDTADWEIPTNIELADPAFYESHSVDLILGAEIFFDLFKSSGRHSLGESQPLLVNSVLGWVVSGRTSSYPPITSAVSNVATVAELCQLMERFWTIEEGPENSCNSPEEAACEEHFTKNVTRTPEGRYIVRLPLKGDVLENLGDNRGTAIRCLRFMETKLKRDSNLGQQYKDFMAEYLELGHMRLIEDHEQQPERCYHMPHHAVVRAESTTTKLRVVFNASCKTPGGPSLNEAMMVGPVVQQNLRSIIIRSRKHLIMLIADAKQMYRQILVDKRDTPLQRIVYRFSPEEPLQTYELVTVTYGTASAPFLATRVLKQLAEDEKTTYPKAAEVLCRDVYVDDLFSGGNTIEEVLELRQQLDALLKRGGFELRKWASNSEAVLEGIPSDNQAAQKSVDLDRDTCLKTLGLHWEPTTDQLRYKIRTPVTSADKPLSKRVALSLIAELFDPLGLVVPVVTTAKIFMQELWMLKDNEGKTWTWDADLPATMKDRWYQYHLQLPLLNELRIDRFVLCSEPVNTQLHFFSDASELAYGACVYVRSTTSDDSVRISLLTAKSKVAPLKKRSIPRLELCAALEAAELYVKTTTALELSFPVEVFFWVDSTVVLCWLKATPSNWVTFVANRVSKIQLATPNCNWRHVAGLQNPADLISRGTSAESLIQNELWWQGPPWLKEDLSNWPTQHETSAQQTDVILETRKSRPAAITTTMQPSFVDEYVAKFSSYHRLLRVTANWRRLLGSRSAGSTSPATWPPLNSEQLNEAEAYLIRLIQQQAFPDDLKLLQKSQPVSPKSRLKKLQPFVGPDGLLRVGGRLNQAPQPYDSRHQILLPSDHHFTVLLVRSMHLKENHAASLLLRCLLRLKYWIIGARDLTKTIVHKCIRCIRARPKLVKQFMAELPAYRITAARPFTTTGIDYWGPIFLKSTNRRAGPLKAYVAVFICFATKAVHLELVNDLSTAKFLQAFRRFTSRRGLCAHVYSDNGRNFLGASNELRRIVNSKQFQDAMAKECADSEIHWHFNPPAASHFGGLWEAAINSAQKHFIRVLGTHALAHDDMETLLQQIECCLNSRPIVPLSDDPSDYQPLAPCYFLIGGPLKAVPDVDYTSVPLNRLRQWQQTQKIFQHIWKRWHQEYLSTLQPRPKLCDPPIAIQKGQLVIVKRENTPPITWPTARILETYPGSDGVVRVVKLQTANGKFDRPANKICLLPIQLPEDTTSVPVSNDPST